MKKILEQFLNKLQSVVQNNMVGRYKQLLEILKEASQDNKKDLVAKATKSTFLTISGVLERLAQEELTAVHVPKVFVHGMIKLGGTAHDDNKSDGGQASDGGGRASDRGFRRLDPPLTQLQSSRRFDTQHRQSPKLEMTRRIHHWHTTHPILDSAYLEGPRKLLVCFSIVAPPIERILHNQTMLELPSSTAQDAIFNLFEPLVGSRRRDGHSFRQARVKTMPCYLPIVRARKRVTECDKPAAHNASTDGLAHGMRGSIPGMRRCEGRLLCAQVWCTRADRHCISCSFPASFISASHFRLCGCSRDSTGRSYG